MRNKFVIALALAVVCLLPVVTGVSTAQQDDPNTTGLDYTVYLPFITTPPCTYVYPRAYVAISKPVVRVGEIVTVTGALMNDCAILDRPQDYLNASPEGLLYPSHAITEVYPQSILPGTYQAFTFTVQAVETGEVTITVGSSYETAPIGTPPHNWWWGRATSRPVVVRILP